MKANIKKWLSLTICIILFLNLFYIPINAASSSITNNGVYFIKNQRTGKYLTAAGTTAGSNIYQADFTGSSLQKFKLVYKETSTYNYYNIVSYANTSLLIDVNNAYDVNGTNIKLFTETTYTNAQRFRFIATNTSTIDSYRIMPKLSTTKVLSITGGSLLSNANVELYTNTSLSRYQDWVLENVSQVDVINSTPIVIHQQTSSTTCGPACVRMILQKHGISLSEDTIKATAKDFEPNSVYGYTYIHALAKTLNFYLAEYNSSVRYKYSNLADIGVDYYTLLFGLAVENNKVIQVVLKNNASTNTGLPYSTGGHYVVLSGMKSDADGSNPYACVSDPYYNGSTSYAGLWEIPMSEIYNFNQAHSAYLILEDG